MPEKNTNVWGFSMFPSCFFFLLSAFFFALVFLLSLCFSTSWSLKRYPPGGVSGIQMCAQGLVFSAYLLGKFLLLRGRQKKCTFWPKKKKYWSSFLFLPFPFFFVASRWLKCAVFFFCFSKRQKGRQKTRPLPQIYTRKFSIRVHRGRGENFPIFISCRYLVELVPGNGSTGCQEPPLRLRVQAQSRTRLRIVASIAFWFRACNNCKPSGPLQHSKMPRTPNLSKICPDDCFARFRSICRKFVEILSKDSFRTNFQFFGKFLTNLGPPNWNPKSNRWGPPLIETPKTIIGTNLGFGAFLNAVGGWMEGSQRWF